MTPISRRRGLRALPLRARLVGSFLLVMSFVLAVAGTFVFWRVQLALDHTLDGQLTAEAVTVAQNWKRQPDPADALAGLPVESLGQILDRDGRVRTHTPAAPGSAPLLPETMLGRASTAPFTVTPGHLLSGGKHRLRLRVQTLQTPDGRRLIAVTAIRIGQRDEALRELLAQLTTANLAALTLAGAVGYRLTRRALDPVEHYRQQADAIAAGATGTRISTSGSDDEISRLGQTLNRMLDAQDASARQQRQFLADASHELRTPLTAIKTEIELALRRDRDSAAYRSALSNVGQDTDRLIRLAEQLLELERTQHTTDNGTCDAAAVITRVTARTGPLMPAGRRLREDLTAAPGTAMPGQDLDQVVTNLLSNAIAHGAGDISVSLTELHDTAVYLITVHDAGDELDPSFLPVAADRFRRQDRARTTPGSGLGLGLVHELVTRAGGELRLCAGATHHTFPPHRFPADPRQPGSTEASCRHSPQGTTSSVLLPRLLEGPAAQQPLL